MKKRVVSALIVVTMLVVLFSISNAENTEYVTNDFFYTGGISTIEYNGYLYPLSGVEKKQKVYLDVTEIDTFMLQRI